MAAILRKMKFRTAFVLVIGILSVIVKSENVKRNNTQSSLDSELGTKQIEELLNKDVFIPDEYQENDNIESDINNENTEVDIIVEENIDIPSDVISRQETESLLEENVQESQVFNPYINKDTLNNDPDEIMETAAGFVPIPIIRNRHKQRRPFITRRNYRRKPYPYRRFYFYHPYPFYYYPSSLRYY